MDNRTVRRRTFLGAMAALPAGVLAHQQTADPSGVGVKVSAGEGRFGRALKLPDGGSLLIKVATQDSGGAFFVTEQPSGRKGGPPKHFHLEDDEWFYCLAGDYIVEVGNQRYERRRVEWSSSFAIWMHGARTSARALPKRRRRPGNATAS